MKFLSLISIEFKKIRRSKILLILAAATIILWFPAPDPAFFHRYPSCRYEF